MRSKALPRAVIFDWDNTLVDSWPAIAEAINTVRAKYGLAVWTMSEIMQNCTRSARESFPVWFGDRWPSAWDDYYICFEEVRSRIGLFPLPGAEDLLVWLKNHDIPAVVVSNKSGKYLRQESTMLGWNTYFVSIAGAHDAVRDKPAREHADHALALGGLTAGPDIWFIGDSEADISCARNANCTPVLIGTHQTAKMHKIDMFFNDCSDVLGLLRANHCAIAAP